MINVRAVLEFQKQNVIDWHTHLAMSAKGSYWTPIEENSKWNFMLWHEEDIARVRDIEILRIVEAKRNIDQYNQSRNNAIEKIDEWILSYLDSKGIASSGHLHSETPGMMIDRLSIMALKRYHMFEETVRNDVDQEHVKSCQRKVAILDEQIFDLADCLNTVLSLLEKGELRFKVYRQFKMYNDPTLNPQLYKKSKKQDA